MQIKIERLQRNSLFLLLNRVFMINEKLFCPDSIAIIGASNNIMKPGGKVLKNLTDHNFKGKLYAVNPKYDEIQGLRAYHSVEEIPEADLAILAIPAAYCLEAVEVLAAKKGVRAFIIVSGGFGETGREGKKWKGK
jgi:acyl-CoA synthetase (NDP forming)